jgi:hypothetical protein
MNAVAYLRGFWCITRHMGVIEGSNRVLWVPWGIKKGHRGARRYGVVLHLNVVKWSSWSMIFFHLTKNLNINDTVFIDTAF